MSGTPRYSGLIPCFRWLYSSTNSETGVFSALSPCQNTHETTLRPGPGSESDGKEGHDCKSVFWPDPFLFRLKPVKNWSKSDKKSRNYRQSCRLSGLLLPLSSTSNGGELVSRTNSETGDIQDPLLLVGSESSFTPLLAAFRTLGVPASREASGPVADSLPEGDKSSKSDEKRLKLDHFNADL